jgi:hypothetical protein
MFDDDKSNVLEFDEVYPKLLKMAGDTVPGVELTSQNV